MSEPESQPNTQSAPQSAPKLPPVHIDRKGRLSVKTRDLAASEAFRARLNGMVKLAGKHPPKS